MCMMHMETSFRFLRVVIFHQQRLNYKKFLLMDQKYGKLQIELAITIEDMEPSVKATYRLEGDGPLFSVLMTLHATIPNA